MKKLFKLDQFLPQLSEDLQKSINEAISKLELAPKDPVIKRIQGIEQKASGEDGENKRIKILASTRYIDRDNEIVYPMGMDLSQFKMNPKILQNHNYSQEQVGKAIKVTRTQDGIPMTIEFAPTDEGEKFRILSMFNPLTFSIGFIPTDVLLPSESGWGDEVAKLSESWPEFKGCREKIRALIRKGILLETSIVNIPANPHALQLGASKALDEGIIKKYEADYVVKAFGQVESLDPDKQKKSDEPPAPTKKIAVVKKKGPTIVKVPGVKPYAPKIKLYSQMPEKEQVADKIGEAVKNTLALKMGKV